MDDRHAAEDMWTGSMWECPDFSALDDRHVLITSIWDKRHFVVSSGVRRHLPHRMSLPRELVPWSNCLQELCVLKDRRVRK